MHLVLPERHIPHRKVKKVARMVGGFKPAHGNIRFLVKLLCDAPGQGIQFYAVKVRFFKFFRHKPEEVPDAAGRLQDVPRLKAHAFYRFVHCLNHNRACIVGIQDCAARRFIFFRGQQFL